MAARLPLTIGRFGRNRAFALPSELQDRRRGAAFSVAVVTVSEFQCFLIPVNDSFRLAVHCGSPDSSLKHAARKQVQLAQVGHG